jgi:predicted nucleotidyltransferase component of viral defense system
MYQANKLFYNTVSPLLLEVLNTIMDSEIFNNFRLVGGTALSLYYGHRLSVDIDVFSDAEYGTIDFALIDDFLNQTYTYVDSNDNKIIGAGKSYYVGKSRSNCIKLDVFYTDNFIHKANIIDGIRLASVEEIIAMKIDIISRGGRKKDFWDIDELRNDYTVNEMLRLHKRRHPFQHNRELIKSNLTHFNEANIDFDPVCLKGKHWELIKLDMIDFSNGIS